MPKPSKYDLPAYAFGGKPLSVRIKDARETAGMKAQADLAEALGMDRKAGQAVVSAWEAGIRMPSVEMVCRICEATKTNPDAILGFKDKKKVGVPSSKAKSSPISKVKVKKKVSATA